MTVRTMALNQLRADGFHGIGFPGSRPTAADGVGSAANRNTPQTNAQIRGAGQSISQALATLTGSDGELFGRTSDADVASVQLDRNRLISSMPPQDTRINVQQIAQAQTNVSDAVTASSRNVTSGVHTFEIEAGGRTHSFEINVQATDDNVAVQRRMATAINEADIGITASVQAGTDNGAATTTLSIASDQTGTNAAFEIRDAAGSSLVSAMQLDGSTTASQTAQNAIFSVGGGAQRTSQTNEVNIGAGATATLTGAGETQITFGRSSEQSLAAARDLVSAINSAIRGTNPDDGRGSQRFLNDLIGVNITFQASLSRMGIDVGRNGQLSINESRLTEAIESGAFENSGFTSRMERIASNAANTRQYANAAPPVEVQRNNFDFSNVNNQWMLMDLFS